MEATPLDRKMSDKLIHFFEGLADLEDKEKEITASSMLNSFGREAQAKNWKPAQIFLNVQHAMDESLIPKHIGEGFLDKYTESQVFADAGPKLEVSNSNFPTAPQNPQVHTEPTDVGGSCVLERKDPVDLPPVKEEPIEEQPGEKNCGDVLPQERDPPQVISLLNDSETSADNSAQPCAEPSAESKQSTPLPPLPSTSLTPRRRRRRVFSCQNSENPKRVKLEDAAVQDHTYSQETEYVRCGVCSTTHFSDFEKAMLNKADLVWKCNGKYKHIVCPRGNPGNQTVIKRHAILEFLGYLALQKGFKTIGSNSDVSEMKEVLISIAKEWPTLQHTWKAAVRTSECPRCIYMTRGGFSHEFFKWVRSLAECYAHIVGSMERDAAVELESAWRRKEQDARGKSLTGNQGRSRNGECSGAEPEGSARLEKEGVAENQGHGGNTFGFKTVFDKGAPPLQPLARHLVQPPAVPYPRRKKSKVDDPVTCSVCKHKPTSEAECCSYMEFIACEPLIGGHALHRVCTFDQKGNLKPCILTILTLWTLFQKTKDLRSLDVNRVALPKLRITEERMYRMADDSIAMEVFSNQCPACTWTCAGFLDPFLDSCMEILQARLKSTTILHG
ncbi:hypothetical protein BSKO_08983 [Bryopsis sp. KO-2023]|nr:hypothetical protein BSKO_08983 [Bryopsis sp. KO-2023]